MTLLLLAGSPSAPSRSTRLLQADFAYAVLAAASALVASAYALPHPVARRAMPLSPVRAGAVDRYLPQR